MKKILSALALLTAAFALAGCTQIDTGSVGVVSYLGQVESKELEPGLHLTGLKKVTEVSTKEIHLPVEDLKPQTSDKIALSDLDVDIYVTTAPDKASEIMSRFVGDLTKDEKTGTLRVGMNYVTRVAREVIFTVVAQHGSKTIHTERVELASQIQKQLQAGLDEGLGKGTFMVGNINVRNLVTDPSLEKSIKAAAQRQFDIEAKEKEIILAEKEADRKRAEAKGDADAIRLRAEAVTKQGGAEYVQLEWIKKWDGKVPQVQGGAGTLVQLPTK